jgi:hypothetical protein
MSRADVTGVLRQNGNRLRQPITHISYAGVALATAIGHRAA